METLTQHHLEAPSRPMTVAGRNQRVHFQIFDLFAQIYLAGTMGWATVLLLPNGESVDAENITFKAFWVVMYVLTICFVILRVPRISAIHTALVVLGFYVDLSAFWSFQPAKTVLYGGALSMNILFCILLADRWHFRKFQSSIVAIIAFSCALGLVMWSLGWEGVNYIDIHDRSTLLGTIPLRFFFYHKITAGIYCAVAIIANTDINRGAVRVLLNVFLSICLLLTGSSSAIAIIALFAIYNFVARGALRRRLPPSMLLLILLIAALTGFLLGPFLLGDILTLLGRDPTLTGRTLLWSWGLDVGWERPVFGWGFEGYMESELAQQQARSFAQFQTYEVPHFHNSYIQMFVDMGAVGLAFVVFIPIATFTKLYNSAKLVGDRKSALNSALILSLLTGGFFIHLFYKHNDFSAVLIFMLYLLVSKLDVTSSLAAEKGAAA